MNGKTYKAIKRVIEFTRGKTKEIKNNDIVAVETWINELENIDFLPPQLRCKHHFTEKNGVMICDLCGYKYSCGK